MLQSPPWYMWATSSPGFPFFSIWRPQDPGYEICNRRISLVKARWKILCAATFSLACENIRFSSLFATGDVSRGGSSARNVPIGEERGETDVFAGYLLLFPNSYKNSHFQNERKCKIFPNFICMRIWNIFQTNTFTLSLALTLSIGATLKLPI